MADQEIEDFYQLRAKEYIDCLFDKNYFREDITRDDMQSVEDLLAYFIKTQCDSCIKLALLINKNRGINDDPSDQ